MKIHDYKFSPDIIFPSFELPTTISITPTKDDVQSLLMNQERVWLITNMEWWFTQNIDNLKDVSMIRTIFNEMGFVLQDKKQFSQDGVPARSVELYTRRR